MLSNIGVPGLIIILVLALIIFGPSKLPEIGKAFGKSLREFKDATRDIVSDPEVKQPPVEAKGPVMQTVDPAAVTPHPSTDATSSAHVGSNPAQK